ncbi:MAG: DUF362 domain-containing protein [Zhaonellaceae bacterium]|jgi:uncharacterized protein (DUF362 family)
MKKVYIMYGADPERLVTTILKKIDLIGELQSLGNPSIVIKPNLVVPQPAEWGATTSPEMVTALIVFLKKAGFNKISIIESSWVGDNTKEAFKVCGYEKISQIYDVPLIDLKDDSYRELEVEKEKIKVCTKALEADYLINMPVLKAHCQTRLTCALKNLKGCIPDQEKRRFHTMGLHRPIALLNKALKSHLTIVDGLYGDLTHEEGGNPVAMNRVIAGRDPVLIDAYAAGLLGYELQDIPYILLAEKLGVGKSKVSSKDIIEINSSQEAPLVDLRQGGEELDYLRRFVVEDQACSACYGNLMHALMRLKEKGLLEKYPAPIYVGQGYKGKRLTGFGVGACTRGFTINVAGCPPQANHILEQLVSPTKEEKHG